ncbi:hypothetical protein [Arcobacter roscoffensis]|uniref:Prepilin-type N-terminal cleavage/methylation domain-containing protein n=1 Tax=Arcobacter roscoffensis TaxID=2961520 RepID=A0ABY5E8U4_9BACT|nr:hypothetical protein [Arcobacter roscoffensis]UTJ07196.1 hypothetical protein NJU99_03660 [Arcobacter roscoffensis]
MKIKQSNCSNMKSSFSLLELILTTLISSIVIVYSLVFIKELYTNSDTIQKQEIAKIDLLATKAFLDKKADFYEDIKYRDSTIFYKNSILLENITDFKMKKEQSLIKIDIKYKNEIFLNWIFKI